MNRSPFITFDVSFVLHVNGQLKPLHEMATIRTDLIDCFNRIDSTKYDGVPKVIKTVVGLANGKAWLLQETWEDVSRRIGEVENPSGDLYKGPAERLTEEDQNELDRWFRKGD